MQREWWISIVQWAIWGFIMTLLTGRLAKSRVKRRPISEANTLRYPIGILILGIVSFAFFAGIALVSNTIGKNDTTSIWTTLVFLFFAALSLPLIAAFCFARHHLSPEGLDYGRLYGRRGFARWVEISSVKYAPGMKWFKLRTESGATIRISTMLMGLPEFAQLLLSRVPHERIDGQTEAVLLETARGNLPSV